MSAPDAFTLSHTLVDRYAALRPTLATFMGVPGHDHRWDDFSPAGAAAQAAFVADVRRAVAALPAPPDRWHALAADTLTEFCDLESERLDHGDQHLDLNSLASSFQTMRMVFDVMDTGSAAGWDNVAARLEGLPAALEGYRALLAEGLSLGDCAARRQVEAVVRQARLAAAPDGFFAGLLETHAASPDAGADRAARLTAALPAVQAALTGLAEWLEGPYAAAAPSADGVGRARYIRFARRFLGLTLDPEETYAWGFAEVRALEAEMTTIAAGLAPGLPLTEVLRRVREDPAGQAPDAESFLATMRARQAQALAELAGVHFDVPEPVRRLEVRRAPDTGTRGAYYMQPSEDFSRPGGVWYCLAGDGPVPLWDEVSTAYHEGFPGHHLQIGIQVALTGQLSRWQRLAEGFSGYAEGWALYAEQLMRELGYYERPEYLLGMLANQLIRALRVVIDIGAHLDLPIPADAPFAPGERWTYDRAVDVLHTRAGMKLDHAESDVTRYFGWPGQAISYKVGQRVILDLREQWRARHGHDTAALRAFHARVLGSGSVSLSRLSALVLS